MSKTFRVAEYLHHILAATERLTARIGGVSKEEFMRDMDLHDITIRHIEVIGEASHNIIKRYPQFACDHPELELKRAYDMRNRVIHGYHDIDLDTLWKTLQEDVPVLRKQVQELLQNLPGEG